MLVKATQRGFLHWIRHPGEIFEIKDHFFSREWMEKVEPTDAAQSSPASSPETASVALSAGPQATAEPNLEAAAEPSNLIPTNPVPPT